MNKTFTKNELLLVTDLIFCNEPKVLKTGAKTAEIKYLYSKLISICLTLSFQLISMLHYRFTLLYYLGYYISQCCQETMVLPMGPQSFHSHLFSLISSWLWVMFILVIVCHLYLAVFYQRNTHPYASATGTDKNKYAHTHARTRRQMERKKCKTTNRTRDIPTQWWGV